jgi:2-polyprenyl-6-methoxyphenol hydroxylase-like FAD-dependent oxidoreductase
MAETDVLVTGAGPTGLVLGYWLKRLGVRVRIIDKTSEPGTTSRALGVQARTLEFYRQVGLADALIDRGLQFAAANLWMRGKRKARAAFGEMGEGLSPYPYMLIFPQDEHERLLIERLAEAGVHVERRTELLSFDENDGRIVARLRGPDGREEECEALGSIRAGAGASANEVGRPRPGPYETPRDHGRAGELVLDLSGASPSCGGFPEGSRFPSW